LSTRSGKHKTEAYETVLTRFEPQRLLPTRTWPFHIPVTNFYNHIQKPYLAISTLTVCKLPSIPGLFRPIFTRIKSES
jgi:hypothetical protein